MSSKAISNSFESTPLIPQEQSAVSQVKVTRMPAQNMLKSIFDRAAYQLGQPPISGKVIDIFFVISDGTMGWRVFSDAAVLASSYLATNLNNPNAISLASHTVQVLTAPNAVVAYQLTGIPTAGNLAFGLLGVARRIEELNLAEILGDRKGKLLGRVGIVKDGLLAAGGGFYLGFRPLAAASAITQASATSLLGRVTTGFGMLGNAAFGAFFAVIGAIAGLNLHWGYKFEEKLNGNKSLPEQIAFLQKQVSVTTEDQKKLIDKYATFADFKAAMIEEALTTGSDALRNMVKEFGHKGISKKEARAAIQSLLAKMRMESNASDSEEAFLVRMGLEIKMLQLQAKKDQKLGRLTSGACIAQIKESLGKSLDDKEAQAIVDKVKATLKTHEKINWAVVVMSVCAVLATVGAFVFTGGIAALVIALIGLSYFFVMAGLDIYSYKQDIMTTATAPHDKKAILIHAAVAIAVAVVMTALMATSVISFGLVPLIVTIVLTVGWVAFDGYNLYKIHAFDKKQLEENPNLQYLLKVLQSKRSMHEIWNDVFAKIPAEETALLCDSIGTTTMLPHFKEKNRQAIIDHLKKIEQLRKDKMQQFLAALNIK